MSNVLQNKFYEKEFTEYVSSYLPDFQLTDSRVEDRRGFSAMKQIGESPKLDLVVFAVTPEASIHARMEISKLSYALLKTHPRAHALIAYHSDDADEWRLSLITTQVTRDKKGIKETVSNPRRYSYVLGPKAKVNTPTKYLITKGKITDLNDLKERFSLEVVNKDFYREISNLFTKLTGGTYMAGKIKKEYKALLQLPSVPEGDQRNLEFAVRLIGRVIFCWFLREKKSPAGTALMPKELLSHNAIEKNADYYHSILEPIFFEVLNKHIKSRKDSYSEQPFSSIPYLNGGLFSPDHDDYFSYNEGKQAINHSLVIIPDDWIKEFFSFLETYNFTIDENVSFDEELSIDPEMLGRIFENLLAEINPETGASARKSTGSYYTPRSVVDFMVDESLLAYLKEKTSISEQKLKAIISYDLEDDLEYHFSDQELSKITEALGEIKILDPACGSGAFPIGALQKIVFILQQVDPEGHRWFQKQIENTVPEIRKLIEREFANKNFNYIRKFGVIRENIFGVDIQPIATEISRLRCFLTLIVDQSIHDELENRGVEPLPNLDFKFVTANTLIQLPGIDNDTLFKDKERIEQLKDLREQFFSSTSSERQRLQLEFKELQNQMLDRMLEMNASDELTRTLSKWSPFSNKMTPWFDSEWMFGIESGFDLVIGNPPYVSIRTKDFSKSDKDYYKEHYALAVGQYDLFILFIEKANQLLNSAGILGFIIPKRFLTNETFEPARLFIRRELPTVSYLNAMMPFEAANVEANVLIGKKGYEGEIERAVFDGNNIFKQQKIKFNELAPLPFAIFPFNMEPKHLQINEKISKASAQTLGTFLEIKRGMECGFKHAAISSKVSPNKMIRGESVKAYSVTETPYYLDLDLVEPNILKDIEIYTKLPKLLTKFVSNTLIFAYDQVGYFNTNTIYNLHPRPIGTPYVKFLLALGNSKVANFWFFNTYSNDDVLFPHIQKNQLDSIPVVLPDEDVLRTINVYVDEILSLTQGDDYINDPNKQKQVGEKEGLLNRLIYKLYGLTHEEVLIIEEAKL